MNADETRAALDESLAILRKANAEVAYYGLRALALLAREVDAETTTLVLDWSDQGDYLTFCQAEGTDLDVDDDDSIASNLDITNQGTWLPLALPPSQPRRRDFGEAYVFDIDALLTATAEPYKEG
jgi:hypothetical protein